MVPMVNKIFHNYIVLFFLGGDGDVDRECPGVDGDPESDKVDRLRDDEVEDEEIFFERIPRSTLPPE